MWHKDEINYVDNIHRILVTKIAISQTSLKKMSRYREIIQSVP